MFSGPAVRTAANTLLYEAVAVNALAAARVHARGISESVVIGQIILVALAFLGLDALAVLAAALAVRLADCRVVDES